MKVKSLSRVRLLAASWTVAYQAPPSMGFSRQEYWSGVPLPSPAGLLRVLLWHKLDSYLNLYVSGFEPKKILKYSFLAILVREGNGTPLQYSCLENPMDGGAW